MEISGNAKVFAMGANDGAGIGSGYDCSCWGNHPELVDTSVTISENAEVMAVGSYRAAAIGNGASSEQGKTTVTITGGTVTAIGGKSSIDYWNGNCYKDLASAIGGGNSDEVQDVTVTINGTTGNTTVNASCWLDQKAPSVPVMVLPISSAMTKTENLPSAKTAASLSGCITTVRILLRDMVLSANMRGI